MNTTGKIGTIASGVLGFGALVIVLGVTLNVGNMAAHSPSPTATEAVSVYEAHAFGEGPERVPAPVEVIVEEPLAVVDAPPAPSEPVYGQYPAGTLVQFIASADPNNASGGYWDINACASGAGYWSGDATYCS